MQHLETALIQINSTVGALEKNTDRIIVSAKEAARKGAQLIVFPELALCGYPPEDLILRPQFMVDCKKQFNRLKKKLPKSIFVVVGAPLQDHSNRYNAAIVFHHGEIFGIYRKIQLPTYGVFDEHRIFAKGCEAFTFNAFGVKVGIHICEDSWLTDACTALSAKRPDLIINLSASPYHRGKRTEREKVFSAAAKKMNAPLLFCNLVGGQDELVFDGGSAAFSTHGDILARAPLFVEHTMIPKNAFDDWNPFDPLQEIYEALKVGLRDYVNKNGFKKTVIAVSGGIDSALTLAIAVDALGAERVVAVTMPSQYSSKQTCNDAKAVAANVGVKFHTIPISKIFGKFTKELSMIWNPTELGLVEENLQARIRGTLIMALSNRFNWLVLTTGNKSEFATGYCTLYGDMVGGFAVIKDIPKTLVLDLCRWRNEQGYIIPSSTLRRPPSAELRPNQKDSDTLPPYETLDPILEAYVEKDLGIDAMIAMGFDEAVVRHTVRLVDRSEYKRRQGPPGIKITPKAFGRDRRMPITNRYCG